MDRALVSLKVQEETGSSKNKIEVPRHVGLYGATGMRATSDTSHSRNVAIRFMSSVKVFDHRASSKSHIYGRQKHLVGL